MQEQRTALKELPRDDDGEPRCLHPYGYVIVRGSRQWSERTGRIQGQADPPSPRYWYEIYEHVSPTSDFAPRFHPWARKDRMVHETETRKAAHRWCDEHPRDDWSLPPKRSIIVAENVPYGYCHCGCGREAKINRRSGKPNTFLKGHHRLERDTLDYLVDNETGCWVWQRHVRKADGYGSFHIGKHGPGLLAHRYYYEKMRGPIPEGLVIDHLCRNRACVNPDHLEVVTIAENVMRGNGRAARDARLRRGEPELVT